MHLSFLIFICCLPTGSSSLCGREHLTGVLMSPLNKLILNYFSLNVSSTATGRPRRVLKTFSSGHSCYSGKQTRNSARLSLTKQASFMNEWVGHDIGVVGPLQIPPTDEFAITDNSHLFGKSAWHETYSLIDRQLSLTMLTTAHFGFSFGQPSIFVTFVPHPPIQPFILCHPVQGHREVHHGLLSEAVGHQI